MRLSLLAASLLALTLASDRVLAQTSSISITAPSSLTVATATAGGQPDGQSTSASYSVTVIGTRTKITAQLDSPLPQGVTLSVSFSAPAGAVSAGPVSLTTASRDVVRYIPIGQYTGLSVTINLSASVSAGVVPFNASHVVLTLVDDP
jgi:hypothetical protein